MKLKSCRIILRKLLRLLKLTVPYCLIQVMILSRPVPSLSDGSHHASVLKIKEARNSSDCFTFKLFKYLFREIRALDVIKKVITFQPKLLKIIPIFFLDFIKQILITLLK